MKLVTKNLLSVLFISLLLTGSGCDNNSESTGYDGRVFDISLAEDNSITATVKKVGSNFELTISGTGQAKSYERKELVPWNAISKKIIDVKIEDGIANIGDYYFASTTIDKFYLPVSVKKVEANSFNPSAKVFSYSTDSIEINCSNNVYLYSESKPDEYGKYWNMIGTTPVVYDQYKMLFIGNSFTFFPNVEPYGKENPTVCALTKEIAASLGIDLIIDSVVEGGHNLKKHASSADEFGKIVDEKLNSSSDYDYVILQEHSTTPVNDYKSFSGGVEALLSKISATQKDCDVYLYATWGFPSGVSDTSIFSSVSVMGELLKEKYHQCADEYNLKVSDVGTAFSYVYDNYPNISLYGSDDKHQSYTGAFLSACVHVANMLQADVREATYLGDLDENTAKTLKETAYNVVFE